MFMKMRDHMFKLGTKTRKNSFYEYFWKEVHFMKDISWLTPEVQDTVSYFCETFSAQGHSGYSANWCIGMLTRGLQSTHMKYYSNIDAMIPYVGLLGYEEEVDPIDLKHFGTSANIRMYQNLVELHTIMLSLSYVVNNYLLKTCKFKPFTDILGTENEWKTSELDAGSAQNKRCGNIFRNVLTKKAYQMDYYVFVDPNGCGYTNIHSRHFITEFPYYPSTVYVHVDEFENIIDPSLAQRIASEDQHYVAS